MSAVYSNEDNKVYISARELCQFVLRGGDIDPHKMAGNKNGSSVISHKLWEMKPELKRGFYVDVNSDDVDICVYGLNNCLTEVDGKLTVSLTEIVDYSLDYIENGLLEIVTNEAMCLGYMACQLNNLNEIDCVVAFEKEGDDQERVFKETLSSEGLKGSFDMLIALFTPYARLIKDKGTTVTAQLANLRFPFEGGPREEQREFIIDTARAIKSHKRLIVQAPTGTGKTIAALYPALKSIGNGEADKIFYLTGKTTTALSALNAIDIMKEQIPDLRAIHISAKDKCCVSFRPGAIKKCDPKHCMVTRQYFDKINVALLELLENHRIYTKELIDEVSAKYGLCSYELSLELSEWCELVVCDYNYLFDLQAYLRRYFEVSPSARFVFLIDEAHNLPDRAREMYSSTLTRDAFKEIENAFPNRDSYTHACQEVIKRFDELYELAMAEKQEIDGDVYGFYINTQLPEDLTEPFELFCEECRALFKRDLEDDLVNQLYLDSKKLLKIAEIYDKRFTMYIEAINDSVKLRIMCLDPAFMLNNLMKNGISTILFSATLTPLEYFTDVLGCEKSGTLSLKSPFDQGNQCLICINNVSTRYEDRKSSANSIASIIRAMIAGKSGNYIVYFPSYSYLTEVMEIFTKKYPKIAVTAQSRSMSEKAKTDFLASFDDKKEETLVGFCVLGGSFSEGIDLRGERLIGAMIVGVGLPTISTELNIIKEHFDKTRENGYAYAYTYPGMNKVMQAAGRVIRSDDERGVVLLVDDRFATPEYQMIMPEYWSHMKYITSARDLLDEVTKFWKN